MKKNLAIGFNYNALQTSFNFAYQSTTRENNWHIFHCHEGMEFLYVHEGNGFAVIDQKIVEMGPRTLVYFQPFQLHGTHVYLDNSAVYIRSILSFEPNEIDVYLQPFPLLQSFFHQIWKHTLSNQHISQLPVNNPMESMFEHYYHILSKPERNEEAFALFIITFLQYMKSIWPEQVNRSEQNPASLLPYIEKILGWIEDNYTLEFQLDTLSQELHLSKHYISHLFHQATGTTITQYVIARRMRQASWLLKTSKFSVQQICQQIGLTNVSYFCKKFKEYKGKTPHQYRMGG